jgi:AAA domain
VPGWETFVRGLLDTEKVELFLSGSSARLLSREVATSMRGRAMEVLVHPLSSARTPQTHFSWSGDVPVQYCDVCGYPVPLPLDLQARTAILLVKNRYALCRVVFKTGQILGV